MSAITPNAKNHEGLNAKDSRFVDVPDLPWEDTKFPGVKAKTLLVDELVDPGGVCTAGNFV